MRRWLAGLPPGPISPEQLAEWEAFHAVEPFGPLRDEQRFARLAATVANAAPFRTGRPMQPSDFSAVLAADKPPVTRAEVAHKADMFFRGLAAGARK